MARYPVKRRPVILVVEDDVLLRIALAEHLRSCTFKVVEAANGAEALTILKSGAAIDLVFSHGAMASEADGVDLTGWLGVNRPQLALIVTTTTNGVRRGKPYDVRQVVADIRRILRKTGA